MPKIVLGIPTISQFDLLHQCIDSACRGTVVPDEIMVIDNSGGMFFEPWADDFDQLAIYVPQRNLGVAGSWNYFMGTHAPRSVREDSDTFVILCNDDIVFHPYSIENLLKGVYANPKGGLFVNKAAGKDQFSCFYVPTLVWSTVGPFDPIFYPAYFEDNDYRKRLSEAGYSVIELEDFTFDHVGSATLKAMNDAEKEAHRARFDANAARYVEKWGGMPGEERFKTAYNCDVTDPYMESMYPASAITI